jgi:uncharacterized protein (TIGR02118 family)
VDEWHVEMPLFFLKEEVQMIVRMGLLTRKQNLSPEAFADYWHNSHGTLVREQMLELAGYIQNRIVDRSQKGIDYKRGSIEVDGISQLLFPTLSAMQRSTSSETVAVLSKDEANFIGELSVLTALQNVVLTPPVKGPFVKRMSFLRKRSDISMERFQDEWFNMHSVLVKRLPGLLGYRQNLVVDRRKDRLNDSELDPEIGIDGVVELWFENADAIDHAFRSPRGNTTMMHAQEFISEISTYMVDAVEIIPEARH